MTPGSSWILLDNESNLGYNQTPTLGFEERDQAFKKINHDFVVRDLKNTIQGNAYEIHISKILTVQLKLQCCEKSEAFEDIYLTPQGASSQSSLVSKRQACIKEVYNIELKKIISWSHLVRRLSGSLEEIHEICQRQQK